METITSGKVELLSGAWLIIYNVHVNTPNYEACRNEGIKAFKSVRECQSIAGLYLTKKARAAIDRLVSEHWYICEHRASCQQEYLTDTLIEVDRAFEVVHNSAKKVLRRSQYAQILNFIKG
ncbi:hypothetical protein [Chitinophaga filiformis]|uniref:Uncharacterized protein n=1 Tax=Chitinophaga filiformis TaxID=104663 RepID=A0ABY4HW22_CHIFI|nr:hypothetical protein [Chitinophaga filiformis]UPK67987.1 hypothetical protein MYF79_23835 [Chitinophaga filiformis]